MWGYGRSPYPHIYPYLLLENSFFRALFQCSGKMIGNETAIFGIMVTYLLRIFKGSEKIRVTFKLNQTCQPTKRGNAQGFI
jgi:hypothetical protein